MSCANEVGGGGDVLVRVGVYEGGGESDKLGFERSARADVGVLGERRANHSFS